MSTAIITTSAYAGSNRLRLDLYKTTDPNSVIDSKGPSTGPIGQTQWIFEDLIPGDGYIYKVVEVELLTTNIIQTVITVFFTIGPGTALYRPPEDIVVDFTLGVDAGQTSATFDGSGGKLDFRGWEIIPILEGVGPMRKDYTYSWDNINGIFTLLNGDTFIHDVRYFFEFQDKVTGAAPAPIVRDAWSSNLYITTNTTLTAADFAKNAIIKGASGYLKVTLPDINTVVPNRLLYVTSTSGDHKCAEIACSLVTGNANKIMWPSDNKNSIFLAKSESLAIYREKVSNSVSYWRVLYPDGNFKTVGEIIYDYANLSNVINKIALDNTSYNNQEYARLYDYITNLPGSEVASFSAWSTGANKYKFSTADGSGKFHVPDLRGVFFRTADGIRSAGDFQNSGLANHYHGNGISDDLDSTFIYGTVPVPGSHSARQGLETSNGPTNFQGKTSPPYNLVNGVWTIADVNTETRPANVAVTAYIRC